MKRFADWSLRFKLLVSLYLVVMAVTALVLAALTLNLRTLRQSAILEQRVILTLSGLIFDYLSEVREYVVESNPRTLDEMAEIEIQLATELDQYQALARGDDPREEAVAAEISIGLDDLTDAGRDVVRVEDRLRKSLEAAETAEEALVAAEGSGSGALALVTRSYELLSEVREYVLGPGEETAAELARIETELAAISEARDVVAGTRITGLLETGRTAVRLRQELEEALERIEDVEQELSGELETAVSIAQEEVTEASQALLLGVLAAGLVGLVLASLLSWGIARRVSRPLEQLQATSKRLAAGELDARSPVMANDEVGRLSADFNHLAAEIERLISQLRQAKAFNESIVASVPSGLVTLDRDGRVTSANPVFREHWSESDPTGSRLARWLASPDLERAVESVLAGGDDVHDLEISHRPSAESAPVIFRTSVVGLLSSDAETGEGEAGALALVIFEDVTESRRLLEELEQRLADLSSTQAQLVQTGKMAAVGELAAGVAHELNNPLSVVLTYSVLLQEKLSRASEEVRGQLKGFDQRLDLMKSSAERCKTIVDNLLLFSRQDDTKIARVDAADLLAKTFDLLGSQLRRRQITLSLEVEDGLPPLRGNFNQLQQVLTNLVINAQQAMVDGGELEVAVRRRGSACELTIADTGPGIPRELQVKIFDPFFTTKPVGQGTGLGLAIAYGIIQGHDGAITVESDAGTGTTFHIRLPFADHREAEA